jgi:hypothetical protein
MVICIQEGKTIYHSRIYMEGNIGDNYEMEVYIPCTILKLNLVFQPHFSRQTRIIMFLEQ